MLNKASIKQFKDAEWGQQQDLERFLMTASDAEASDIPQLLNFLVDTGLSQDRRKHQMRMLAFKRLAGDFRTPELTKHYLRAIKLGDRSVRQLLLPFIQTAYDSKCDPDLVDLLRQKDPYLRQQILNFIKQNTPDRFEDLLKGLIQEPDCACRMEIMDIVVPAMGARSVNVLQAVLASGTSQEALAALQKLGDPVLMNKARKRAAEAILTLFKSPDPNLQQRAVAAFCGVCTENDFFQYVQPFLDSDNYALVQAVVHGMRFFPTRQVIQALERKLRGGPNVVRLSVLDTAESIANDDVLPLIVEGLSHKNPQVRSRAGEVLSNLSRAGKVDTARTVLWLMRSPDNQVRRMAAEIVRNIPDPAAELWPRFLTFLVDEDWWVREALIDSLIDMAGAALSPYLVSYLEDPSEMVRQFAINSLRKLRDPRSLGALIRTAQQDGDWWVREIAVGAIVDLGDRRSVPYLIDMLVRFPELQLVCTDALAAFGDPQATPYVASLLASPDADIRIAALKCLEKLNAVDVLPELEHLLEDPDVEVQAQAEALITKWTARETRVRLQMTSEPEMLMDRLLLHAHRSGADDLILAADRRPMVKHFGKVLPLADDIIPAHVLESMIIPRLSAPQMLNLKALKDVDFSHRVKAEDLRFRANAFFQLTGLSVVFRRIPTKLPSIAELGLPEVVRRLPELPNGLVLVGGPTGAGKSTTLAAIINNINQTSGRHIVTLEDPIEAVHVRQRGLINQREMGSHALDFRHALRSAVRQDPDVILIGEMRDFETISFAVNAAETGHLVFGTVHTVSADTTVERLVNVFPAAQQDQVRTMLADSLRAVVCQHLLPRADAAGRVLGVEVMFNSDAISNLIRKGKSFQIPQMMATSRETGMQTMDQDLMRLFREGLVTWEDAYMKAFNKKEFEEIMGITSEKEAEEALAAERSSPSIMEPV